MQNLSRATASRGTRGKGAETEDSNYLLLVADRIHVLFPFQICKEDISCGHVTRGGGVKDRNLNDIVVL